MRRACAAALLLCAALAHAHSYKRAEMSASPFVLSSRYGRSSPRMSPRNDRFFLTGRYGKRSYHSAADRLELATDRDSLRALESALESDRDRHTSRWRPRCSCRPYERATYYKRAPELADGSSEGQ